MTVNINEDNLTQGMLGLVIALVEIIRDALRLQAIRRIDSGRLVDDEIERLGTALADLDGALEDMKKEQGVDEVVQSVRDNLDGAVSDVLNQFINPKQWAKIERQRRANPGEKG